MLPVRQCAIVIMIPNPVRQYDIPLYLFLALLTKYEVKLEQRSPSVFHKKVFSKDISIPLFLLTSTVPVYQHYLFLLV
jgi:hypothetical protein